MDSTGYPVTGPSAATAMTATLAIRNSSVCKSHPFFEVSAKCGRSPAIALGDTEEEARANARLIAAAPALLEALQNLLDHCDRLRDPAREVHAARAAIQSATGEKG
jgi:hypothetical protein